HVCYVLVCLARAFTSLLVSCIVRRPPSSTLFPYTTLFHLGSVSSPGGSRAWVPGSRSPRNAPTSSGSPSKATPTKNPALACPPTAGATTSSCQPAGAPPGTSTSSSSADHATTCAATPPNVT